MKKIITFLTVLMAATCVFAAGAKWKSSEIYNEKKFNKLVETYKLSKVYEKDTVEFYKNEDSSDWIFILREGSEEKNDDRIYFISFANLGGKFDSCTVYGGFTDHSENVKYFYSYINEASTTIPEGDFKGKSTWIWNYPNYIFYYMFTRRIVAFNELDTIKEIVGITLPEDVYNKYLYFGNWIVDNNRNEDIVSLLPQEYRKYLKEHK